MTRYCTNIFGCGYKSFFQGYHSKNINACPCLECTCPNYCDYQVPRDSRNTKPITQEDTEKAAKGMEDMGFKPDCPIETNLPDKTKLYESTEDEHYIF